MYPYKYVCRLPLCQNYRLIIHSMLPVGYVLPESTVHCFKHLELIIIRIIILKYITRITFAMWRSDGNSGRQVSSVLVYRDQSASSILGTKSGADTHHIRHVSSMCMDFIHRSNTHKGKGYCLLWPGASSGECTTTECGVNSNYLQ